MIFLLFVIAAVFVTFVVAKFPLHFNTDELRYPIIITMDQRQRHTP